MCLLLGPIVRWTLGLSRSNMSYMTKLAPNSTPERPRILDNGRKMQGFVIKVEPVGWILRRRRQNSTHQRRDDLVGQSAIPMGRPHPTGQEDSGQHAERRPERPSDRAGDGFTGSPGGAGAEWPRRRQHGADRAN